MNPVLLPLIAKKAPKISRLIGRQTLSLKKNAPHIFFVGGAVGMVTSTVMACKATLKLPETLEEIENDLGVLKELRHDDINVNYPSNEITKDTAYVYGKSAGKLLRLYGPAAGVGLVSLGALTGAHVNLSRRNTALMAAYATLSTAYENYRERVAKEFGKDEELDLYHAKVDEIQIEGSDEVTPVVDSSQWSPYARMFDEKSEHFVKNAEYNRLFLTAQQNWANDILTARGHLFLNEVYDMLGFDRTPEGSVVGWFRGGDGDDYVEFGFHEVIDFINGYEPRVILDFNVDGVIYDKL